MTGEEGGKSSADSEQPVAARESVTLNEANSLTALGYLKERPFMWWCGTAAYRLGKADREQGWIELGSRLGLSCEYHFFLFIIVSTGDVHK